MYPFTHNILVHDVCAYSCELCTPSLCPYVVLSTWQDYIETADFELDFNEGIMGIGGVPEAGKRLTQQVLHVQSQRESQRQLQTQETTFIDPQPPPVKSK